MIVRLTLLLVTTIMMNSNPCYGEDCDAVLLSSNATAVTLHERGQVVSECLTLASEMARLAYTNAFTLCKKHAVTRISPTAITFPDGEVVTPPPTMITWEEFAKVLGSKGNSSGCRDGILSALVQKTFSSVASVQNIFTNTEMFLSGPFNGDYDVKVGAPPFFSITGTIHITDSSLRGYLTDVSGVTSSDDGKIAIFNMPFEGEGVLTAKAQFALIDLDNEAQYYSKGHISGEVDVPTLTVTLSYMDIDQFETSEQELNAFGNAIINKVIARNELKHGISYELTRILRNSYEAIDPFHFIQTLPRQ
ncbi:MAG: hypothetical protein HQK52_09230 [Oligoflexia bacterium]|nr:hypothetical protein [Oligoflexia bacterium]